jgi:hypothetical protein
MEDIGRILLAFILGYAAFVTTFYYLAKLMFPKVELDEEYEQLIANYKKSKPRQRVVNANKRFDPSIFKISNSLKHRVNYKFQ